MKRRAMPSLRLPRRRNAKPSGGRRLRGTAALLLGAALYALAEMALALAIGLFGWGRAEALLFFFVRPWLLLAAAVRIAESRWPRRFSLYALALIAAGLGESLFLSAMGAADPWPEMLRGWAAGALLAVLFDGGIQLGCRLARRTGKLLAAAALALLLVAPGGLGPYEWVALGPTAPARQAERPRLVVLTSLPLVWGESGPFDPNSRPAASWQALEAEFDARAIDYVDTESLMASRLMLLAQPRLLSPEELVRIDSWVRQGGAILILTDEALVWPSALAPGDPRRPVAINMLGPLLTHWGVTVDPPDRPETRTYDLRMGDSTRRLELVGAGRLRTSSGDCRPEASFLLSCRIGRGPAIIVADADLLHDSTWVGPGARGGEKHMRRSDNPLALADWLDRLSGIERRRALGTVQWADPAADRRWALLLGAIPSLVFLLLALAAARLRA